MAAQSCLAGLTGSNPPSVQPAERRFREMISRYVRRYGRMWMQTAAEFPRLLEEYDLKSQKKNEIETDCLLDYLEREFARCPDTEERRRVWRAEVLRTVRRFGIDSIGFPASYLDTLFSTEYIGVTRAFLHRSKAFDDETEFETLFQALRNVWIMNSIQMFLGRGPSFSPSIFAYSMLYPYTDNAMDDPTLPLQTKMSSAGRLGARLSGLKLEPEGCHERDLFRLVEMIEAEFPRDAFPDVHQSLLAIHRAQVKSLSQQGRSGSTDPGRILEISFEKGGASVLSDGYLVAGTLSCGQAEFFFGYGVFLQLLDDLQDVQQDLAAGHETIFTLWAKTDSLDRPAGRLCRFMYRVLESSSRFHDPRAGLLKDIIRRNCTFLLLQAVANNPDFFGNAFRKAAERYSPVRFRYLRKSRRSIWKRYDGVKRELLRRGNFSPVFDLLG